MSDLSFDPIQFYSSYPDKVIKRPGYPIRASYKSTLLFDLYGKYVFRELNRIKTYADIGGCFGFGANTMQFHIAKCQGIMPRTVVFEIASEFTKRGSILFPEIEFTNEPFEQWNGDISIFDLITLFDVIEHVVDPFSFLNYISKHAKFIMLKTPMETQGEWRRQKPRSYIGQDHPDGHIHFYSPETYEKLLKTCDLEIISKRLIRTIVPKGANRAFLPEHNRELVVGQMSIKNMKKYVRSVLESVPYLNGIQRKLLGGGDHICICRSKNA